MWLMKTLLTSRCVNQRGAGQLESYISDFEFSADMDPYDYEILCAKLLQRDGWTTRVTQGSGDQGVDVLAEKNGMHIALQCKKYSSPVGNNAVQEIYTGSEYYDCTKAVVVTNNTYTPSARRLAAKLDVLLIHHEDLSELSNLLEKRK